MYPFKELYTPTLSPVDVVLIYPPVSKPSEPPAGVARLKGALQAHGISSRIIDANLGGLEFLLSESFEPQNAAEAVALHRRYLNRRLIASISTFKRFDRYKASVLELNRHLAAVARRKNAFISLTDFALTGLSPHKSDDLLAAAEKPQLSPFYDYYAAELIPTIDHLAPKLIGVSIVYLSQALPAFALLGLLRRHFSGVKLVIGGGLVTSWLSRPNWRDPFTGLIDRCIAGEGEAPLLQEMGCTQTRTPFSLPDYNDTPPQNYFSPLPVIPYNTSAGCWWRRCRFCPETAEQSVYRAIPSDRALRELQALVGVKAGLYHLLDNAVPPALLRQLAEEPLPAPWYGYVRFGEELADEDFVHRLRRNGCIMLQLGLESGDQSVLDAMQKGIDLRTADAVLRCLKRAGIGVYLYVLFGTPWETLTSARQTLRFVADHAEGICGLNAAIFNLPSHGDAAGENAARPFYEADLSLYSDFDHPHGWDRQAVRRFLQDEFRAHPAVRRIVNAVPPAFTSNHAPFFHPSFHKVRSHAHSTAL